jgi:hypothetical protein
MQNGPDRQYTSAQHRCRLSIARWQLIRKLVTAARRSPVGGSEPLARIHHEACALSIPGPKPATAVATAAPSLAASMKPRRAHRFFCNLGAESIVIADASSADRPSWRLGMER